MIFAILFFIAYSLFVFLINNLIVLAVCTGFNIILAIAFKKITKRYFVMLLKNMPFVLMVFGLNLIFDTLFASLVVAWKILIVLNFSYVFAKIFTNTQIANGLSQLFYPLKVFKVNPDNIAIMIVVALNFISIFENEIKTLGKTLKARNIKLTLKTVFTQTPAIFTMFFARLFRRTNELELSLKARGYE